MPDRQPVMPSVTGPIWYDADGDPWEELPEGELRNVTDDGRGLGDSTSRFEVENRWGPLVGPVIPQHQPRRGSDVEAWLKRERDKHDRYGDGTPDWMWCALDNLLDNYRLHADTGVPLDSTEAMGPTTAGVTDDA
jgi:hypothetical protein